MFVRVFSWIVSLSFSLTAFIRANPRLLFLIPQSEFRNFDRASKQINLRIKTA